MAVPKSNVDKKIKKNRETKGRKKRKPKKLEAPKKGAVKALGKKKETAKKKEIKKKPVTKKAKAKPKVEKKKTVKKPTTKKKTTVKKKLVTKKAKPKPKVEKKPVPLKKKVPEDNSYDKLSNIEPMFNKEFKEEVIEQAHTEMELEEKNIMLKMAKSIIISTLLTILIFFIIDWLTVTSWETSLPVLIVIWIVTTLLAYLFQTN
jgi:hypothetical protein